MIISSLHIYFLSMNKIFLDFSLNSLVIFVLINCLWWQMESWLWNNNFREIQFCWLRVRWRKSQQTLKWKAIKEAMSLRFWVWWWKSQQTLKWKAIKEAMSLRLRVWWWKSQQTLKWKSIKEARNYEFAVKYLLFYSIY